MPQKKIVLIVEMAPCSWCTVLGTQCFGGTTLLLMLLTNGLSKYDTAERYWALSFAKQAEGCWGRVALGYGVFSRGFPVRNCLEIPQDWRRSWTAFRVHRRPSSRPFLVGKAPLPQTASVHRCV